LTSSKSVKISESNEPESWQNQIQNFRMQITRKKNINRQLD